jgi:hypothetical protein
MFNFVKIVFYSAVPDVRLNWVSCISNRLPINSLRFRRHRNIENLAWLGLAWLQRSLVEPHISQSSDPLSLAHFIVPHQSQLALFKAASERNSFRCNFTYNTTTLYISAPQQRRLEKMPYLETAQQWLTQSTLLLQARPTTVPLPPSPLPQTQLMSP